MDLLEKLCKDLRGAADVFSENERLGAGKALSAVNDYLDGIGVPPDLSMPLLALLAALQDLEHGKQPEILTKTDISHGPPMAIAVQLERAHAAAAMDLLIKAGDRKEVAARAVASALRKNGIRNVTWKQVARWRDEVKKKPKGDLAASAYYAWTLNYRTHGQNPREHAKALMTDWGWFAPATIRKI